MARTVIGLDIGTTKVRAVELQRGRKAPTVVRYGETPVPLGAVRDGEVVDPSGVVTALRELWSRVKFSHKDVILGVGNQRVLVRSLELPWMPMPQIRSSLPFQVQDTLPVAVQDALLDYYPTGAFDGPNGRTLEGLLVAVTRDSVQANIAAVESASLRPLMVDLNGFAMLRAHNLTPSDATTAAIVDIGARITTVVIAERGMPRLVRILPSGGQNLTDAVAMALSTTGPEAETIKRDTGVGFTAGGQVQSKAADVINHVAQGLIESIHNTFAFYSSNNPGRAAQVIVLTGGGSYLTGLGQFLSSASRMAVTIGDPLAAVEVGRGVDLSPLHGVESTFAHPLGLALGVAA